MRCIIILNGIIERYSAFDGFFFKSDFIICADGGMRHAKTLKVTPNVVLGDFDSFDIALIDGDEVLEYPVHKDQTDGEIAVEYALNRGFEEIVLIGALGGRLDHMMANIFLLEKVAKQGKKGWIFDENQQVYYMDGGVLELHGKKGDHMSLIPISSRVEEINLTGFEYPLENHTVLRGSTHGISNVFKGTKGKIKIGKGVAAVVKSSVKYN